MKAYDKIRDMKTMNMKQNPKTYITLIPEMIFVNPMVKCCVATRLMTDLCLNVHKTGLSECIYMQQAILERIISKIK